MTLEVSVDHGLCMSAGECLYHASSSFVFDDDDHSVFVDPPGDDEATIIKAAGLCPNFAISVRRDGEVIV